MIVRVIFCTCTLAADIRINSPTTARVITLPAQQCELPFTTECAAREERQEAPTPLAYLFIFPPQGILQGMLPRHPKALETVHPML